jgi:HlyD family secretion protein
VQVKVQVLKPDNFLRPEMNARAAFLAKEGDQGKGQVPVRFPIIIPTAAVRDSGGKKSIFVVFEGKANERSVRLGNPTSKGVEVAEGLIGGEEIVVNPPVTLKDGDRVLVKQKQG